MLASKYSATLARAYLWIELAALYL